VSATGLAKGEIRPREIPKDGRFAALSQLPLSREVDA
jgi:hypothetical protein